MLPFERKKLLIGLKMSQNDQRKLTELRGMILFRLLWDASVKRYKAINNSEIVSTHVQTVALVCKGRTI